MTDLTPRELVAELDKFIVGQADAKRAVAVAVRNRWRRQQLPAEVARDVSPKNIVMSGPTGVGKTEIARRLASLVGAPFVKVEATKFTEVGYYGRDVESIVRDLVEVSIDLVRREQEGQVQEKANGAANERLLDALLPAPEGLASDEEAKAKRERTRARFRERLVAGEMEETEVEIKVQRQGKLPMMGGGGQGGMQIDPGMEGMLESLMPKRSEAKRLPVKDARPLLANEEAAKLIDEDKVKRLAVERAEQAGIVFLDEIDKVVAKSGEGRGPDVSREGVQRDLLPIVEGSTVTTKHGPVKTDHVLFIAAGAFHAAAVSDLMPELQGRFPIRVQLDDLTKDDFVRILTEPRNALLDQQRRLLETEGLVLEVTGDGIDAMATMAFDVNRRQQNIGARRLYTIVERVLEEASFDAPERRGQTLRVDAAYVREKVGEAAKDEDLSAFIL